VDVGFDMSVGRGGQGLVELSLKNLQRWKVQGDVEVKVRVHFEGCCLS
jgi:hypothetical protein